jgi:hypothetical protein
MVQQRSYMVTKTHNDFSGLPSFQYQPFNDAQAWPFSLDLAPGMEDALNNAFVNGVGCEDWNNAMAQELPLDGDDAACVNSFPAEQHSAPEPATATPETDKPAYLSRKVCC